MQTLCYTTVFVCESLRFLEAKARYRELLPKVRERCEVLYASEYQFDVGESRPLFSQYVQKILGTTDPVPTEISDKYTTFLYTTIARVPESAVQEVADLLKLDDAAGESPMEFPSHVVVTPMV
ncbi:MAG: hypothetical protein Q4A82_03575 [Corynebacterium sp.]|nr:hypothetical protein [Corynebacterium sp.]